MCEALLYKPVSSHWLSRFGKCNATGGDEGKVKLWTGAALAVDNSDPTPVLTNTPTIMVDELKERSRLQLRLRALSRWEDEGGAPERCADDHLVADHMPSDHPPLSNAELVQLRVRVIALENVIIALLSQADEPQLQRVREMTAYISPRPGFTHHPLTLHAAAQMSSLVERAENYQAMADPVEAAEQAGAS